MSKLQCDNNNNESKTASRKRISTITIAAICFCILGIIVYFLIIPDIPGGHVTARKAATIQTIKTVAFVAIDQFKRDNGRYPTEEEGLFALIQQPGRYLRDNKIPKDGWGNDLIYRLNPKSTNGFVIISSGEDGKEPSEDDISSDSFYKQNRNH